MPPQLDPAVFVGSPLDRSIVSVDSAVPFGDRLARLWRTVRHLRPIQIYGRARFVTGRPRVDLSPPPERRRTRAASWTPLPSHPTRLLAPSTIVAIGQSVDVHESGWDAPDLDKLLRYNLHYFDILRDDTAEPSTKAAASRLMEQWVKQNPPGVGTGWEPYPTSLRIVNWVKWAMAGNALADSCEASLAVQARWLTRRMEHHLLGNHLFANAKALLFAATWFDGAEAARWASIGAGIIEAELREQVLADGGHFERSPMYHALALEDLMDLCNLAGMSDSDAGGALARVADACRNRIGTMRTWLGAMTHPDGQISFFNDAAFDVAPTLAQLDAYARRLGLGEIPPPSRGLTWLAASGYARLANETAVALVDLAPVGPDYLPGHAHADTLSFELSILGRRVVVNSGTSRYGRDAERQRQRGTRAHSTVTVGGHDSSEVWAGFRVGRRARVHDVRVRAGTGEIEGTHDGYRFLSGAPRHRRCWTLTASSLSITDHVVGARDETVARFHLHPGVSLLPRSSGDERMIRLQLPGRADVEVEVEGGLLTVEDSTWHPRFGMTLPTRCLVVRFETNTLVTRVRWSESA